MPACAQEMFVDGMMLLTKLKGQLPANRALGLLLDIRICLVLQICPEPRRCKTETYRGGLVVDSIALSFPHNLPTPQHGLGHSRIFQISLPAFFSFPNHRDPAIYLSVVPHLLHVRIGNPQIDQTLQRISKGSPQGLQFVTQGAHTLGLRELSRIIGDLASAVNSRVSILRLG